MNNTYNTQLKLELAGLGLRLRGLRNQRGWTLEELAQRTELSEAYLSRLESGDRQPSLAVLLNLAQTYGLTLSSLFEPQQASPGIVIRSDSTAIQQGNGILYKSLSDKPSSSLHPIHVIVPLNRQGDCLYQHDGEEWLYVLSGQLVLTLADEVYTLQPGDAAHFDASTPHRLSAIGEEDAEIILVACAVLGQLLSSYV